MLKFYILSLKMKFYLVNMWECKIFFVRKMLKGLNNRQGTNSEKQTLNDFLRKLGTTGLTECTAVSGQLFCY